MTMALHLQEVSKRYGAHAAVDNVSLSVGAGRCVALLGHNGAGKTTLMKMMLGLTRPSAGTVAVLGRDPVAAGLDGRRRIGFLPENVAFHDEMTGRDTLHLYARLKGEDLEAIDARLDAVGLGFAADRRVRTYSKGMRQRLGLAQALLGEPQLLLLDEPTTGLDPVLRQEFFGVIKAARERGATIVLSSHILTELEARVDTVAILCRGHLVAWGTLDELRHQAALPVRIRVAAAGTAADLAGRLGSLAVARVDDQAVEFSCRLADKMAVLRAIAALGDAVSDVDIQLPSLDDVYTHFGEAPEHPA